MNFRYTFLLSIFIVACVTVFAVKPLFGARYIPTHDGEYHIIRITEFSRMLSSGVLFPRWAPTMNSGYGVPVFQYNYPLPNYIGSFIRIFTRDSVYAFQYAMGIGYILISVCIFLWLYSLWGLYPALIGTVTGMCVPYLFVDLYIRGSVGEIWAIAFLFFSLWSIEKKHHAALSFGVAGLILSHNILALIFVPFVIFYSWLSYRHAVSYIAAGIGMAAVFWIPALLEQKYVVGLNTVSFREHFVQAYELLVPSWGSGFSSTGSVGNKISFQLGLAPVAAMLLAVVIRRRTKKGKHNRILLLMLGVQIFCIFAMMSVSTPFWQWIPLVRNIQYPWRLLSFVIPVSAFAGAYWANGLYRKRWGILLVFFAFALSFRYMQPVTYEPRNELYYQSRKNFTDGTSSMGNSFSTVWSGWKPVRSGNMIELSGGSVRKIVSEMYTDKTYAVHMDTEGSVTFNIAYFPGWTVYVDGYRTEVSHTRDGVIHAAIPVGDHMIRVVFENTWVRTVSVFVSVISLAVLIAWGILRI